ncbi:MAG: hypothetical protein AAFZ07_09420 [Actinomycetota bacterium]
MNRHLGEPGPGHERLRSLVALAHCVPGVRLVLRCRRGDRVVVGNAVDADVDSETMRRVVVASADPLRPDCGCLVDDVEVLGSVTAIGGGVFRGTHPGIATRWFVSSLHASEVDRVLDEVGPRRSGVVSHVTGDPLLGRCVVGLAIDRGDRAGELDALIIAVAAECLVRELAGGDAHLRNEAG